MFALFLVTVSLISVGAWQGYDADEYRLRSDISRRYDVIRRQIRPVKNPNDAVTVSLGMNLIKILDFDEVKDEISVYIFHEMTWPDANLAWDPEDYGGLQMIRLSTDQIWRPDIHLYSSLQPSDGLDNSVLAVVTSDGTVLQIRPGVQKIFCDPNEDTDSRSDSRPGWVCKFKYGSWTHDGTQINLSLYNNKTQVDLSNFAKDRRYQVLSTKAQVKNKFYPCCPESPYPEAMFRLRLNSR